MRSIFNKKIKAIISERAEDKYRSYQIVTEWEDIIGKNLNIPIKNKGTHLYVKFFKRIEKLKLCNLLYLFDSYRPVKNYYLYFQMEATTKFEWCTSKNIIPIIVDFWFKTDKLNEFYKSYSNCKLILISSKEVYDFLIQNKCPLPIIHFPLSLPDNSITKKNINKRNIDFLFAGRKDPIFFDYVLRYEKENSNIEYVYQELDGLKPYYISNLKGRLHGDFFSREGYTELLNNGKFSFYTTPGKDPSKKTANGFNQVTPRFLELLSAGCFVLGRYSDNSDVQFYNLNELCPQINSYEDFKDVITRCQDLSYFKTHIAKYSDYIQKHLTSNRAVQLKIILAQNNFHLN